MITRIKINGFKNLMNVDVHLDLFTCIAGVNAVGKSNFFDAVRFLSDLSYKSILEAAKSVRSESQQASSIRDIFFKLGDDEYLDTIAFEVDMIIPTFAFDDLDEKAEASVTSVKYELALKYEKEDDDERIVITKEILSPTTQSETKSSLYFEASKKWIKSVVEGKRNALFISTDGLKIRLHQDKEKGKPYDRIASQLKRTVLSTLNAEYPTAYVVRHEMKSWTLLQLEPSAMRKSDEFDIRKTASLAANGANIPATLYRLQTENPEKDVYQQLSNRLSELIHNVSTIEIDKDEKRALLTLLLKFKGNVALPARSLSDGTLRFLALSILEIDNLAGSIICLEEPENGIHPSKIKEIIQLLLDIACDTSREIDESNLFRQVIINTHSPVVVREIREESLLVADSDQYFDTVRQKWYNTVKFKPLDNTWRMNIPNHSYNSIAIGKLLYC